MDSFGSTGSSETSPSLLAGLAIPISTLVQLAFGTVALYLSLRQKTLRDGVGSGLACSNTVSSGVESQEAVPEPGVQIHHLLDTAQNEGGEEEEAQVEFFITAKRSMTTWTVAWSFFATSVGAGILFAPASFAVHPVRGAGWVGLVVYSLMTGIPILVVAELGRIVRLRYPHILSLGDYVRHRFGRTAQIYVTGLILFNTSIALCTEYTAIGDLFVNIIGSGDRFTPIVLVGAITSCYTIAGGLAVSIITDSFQGIFSCLLLLITLIYLTITFRPTSPLPPLPPHLAINEQGLGSIITLGISLPISAVFTDATWQRVWSSVDDRSLMQGAYLATGASAFFVFCFGFGGFLAAWAGYVSDPNTAFFDLITAGGKDITSPASIAITLLVILIAVAMNESAIDSFQTALTDTVVSVCLSFGVKVRLAWARVIVLLINLPIMVIALQGFDIIGLFLITNMVTTTSAAPLVMGLWERWDEVLDEAVYFTSCVVSFLSLVVLSLVEYGSVSAGMYTYFFESYSWKAFLTAFLASVFTCHAVGNGRAWYRRKCQSGGFLFRFQKLQDAMSKEDSYVSDHVDGSDDSRDIESEPIDPEDIR